MYRFNRMPFGLKNAPGTFQRTTDIMLASAKWQYAIVYLGHIISPGKLQIAHKACEAIKGQVPPKSLTDMRASLGFCNVYRRFVENFARIAHPLTPRLKKSYGENFPELNTE